MSSNAPGPRPRQVTVGGWLVAVASAMLVVSVFDSMAGLQSVDTRDALTRALTTGSAKSLGLSVEEALGIVRAALYVAAVAAVVTGILGVFVLQRHRTARVVLTVAAVPVVLTAPFSGGVLALLVGLGTGMLWSQPARDWFAGRAPRVAAPRPERRETSAPAPWAPPAPPSSASSGPASGSASGSASGPVSQPPPTPGWGQQPVAPAAWPPPIGYADRPAYGPAYGRSAVPAPVRIACILTWIFSSLTAALYLLVGLALLVDRDQMLDLLRDNPTVRDSKLDADQLVTVIVAVSALVVLWCLAACGLAVLAWRRHAWAWILLTVSVGVAALVELAGLPYSLLHLLAAGVAMRMLLSAPARAWFRENGPPSGWPPPPEHTPPADWAPPQPGPADSPPDDRPPGPPSVW